MKKIRDFIGRIPFNRLDLQHSSIKREIDLAVSKVFSSGNYILGEECEALEKEFAQYCGAKYAIGVSSGTDALHLSLIAVGVGENSEVITAPNTAVPTVSAILSSRAKPIFADIDEATYTIDPTKVKRAITKRTKAIIPIHLYGYPSEMQPLIQISKRYGVPIIEDAAQAHGALYRKKHVGTFGLAGCFSFYPTKNLGCYGDGGIVITNDKSLAKKIRLLRNYGKVKNYRHDLIGFNCRIDELQAAILRVKLRHLDNWNTSRIKMAGYYDKYLPTTGVVKPTRKPYAKHVYHLYVIRLKKRDLLKRFLDSKGIQTMIHYPIALYKQPAFRFLKYNGRDFPVCDRVVKEILSLPLYIGLKEGEIKFIAETIKEWIKYL